MITIPVSKTTTDAKQQVKSSRTDGFTVSSVRSYHSARDEGKNPASHYTNEMWMSTPYEKDGKPLVGYCTVYHDGAKADLEVSTVELWTTTQDGTPDKNLEDVYESEHGTRNWTVNDKDGNTYSMDDVEHKVAKCAAATSYFPHVMTYDEYMEFQTKNLEKIRDAGFEGNAGVLTEDSYFKYLDAAKQNMRSGTMNYVGRVRDPESVQALEMDTPSFKRGYEEFEASIEDQQNYMG